jgi:hypothetical protein
MFDYRSYYFDENEKPLDRLTETGGFTAIFRTIGWIGDSLSSGEFECRDPYGKMHWDDCFEYSVGQFVARMCGSKVYNFSRGGMTAKEYMSGWAESKGFLSADLAAQAYVIALGWNDLFNGRQPEGDVCDINDADPSLNADTFAGWYGRLVAAYKAISPDAKFFFVTCPRVQNPVRLETARGQAALLRSLAGHFSNSYVIDLFTYGPVQDEEFRRDFNLLGHRNPMGYMFSARIVASYIDWIIRHNMADFRRVGYINTPLSDSEIARMQAEVDAAASAAAEAGH